MALQSSGEIRFSQIRDEFAESDVFKLKSFSNLLFKSFCNTP